MREFVEVNIAEYSEKLGEQDSLLKNFLALLYAIEFTHLLG